MATRPLRLSRGGKTAIVYAFHIHDHKEHWSYLFTRRLNNTVALTGASINFHHCSPHVQSMMMCMDQRAMKLLLERNILWLDDRLRRDKDTLIRDHEIAASTAVLN